MSAACAVYMLDTNFFNRVREGELTLPSSGSRLLVIGVQAAELNATPNPAARAALRATFEEISPTTIHAASIAFDIEGAGWDQGYWNDGSGRFEKMLGRLQDLDKRSGKRPKPDNQVRDILIAETSIKEGAILVSDDGNLRQVVREFNGDATEFWPWYEGLSCDGSDEASKCPTRPR